MARFVHEDGRTREANTPAAAVKLRFEGWREVPADDAPDDTASDPAGTDAGTDSSDKEQPRATTDD